MRSKVINPISGRIRYTPDLCMAPQICCSSAKILSSSKWLARFGLKGRGREEGLAVRCSWRCHWHSHNVSLSNFKLHQLDFDDDSTRSNIFELHSSQYGPRRIKILLQQLAKVSKTIRKRYRCSRFDFNLWRGGRKVRVNADSTVLSQAQSGHHSHDSRLPLRGRILTRVPGLSNLDMSCASSFPIPVYHTFAV